MTNIWPHSELNLQVIKEGKRFNEFANLNKTVKNYLTENFHQIQPNLGNEKINLVHLFIACIFFNLI